MRLWSLHPSHLDSRGLVALWREGLLARASLSGRTRAYRNHPQLARFIACGDPVGLIDCYLSRVLDEARLRGYHFDESKIRYKRCRHAPVPVTDGQLQFEWTHLLAKLAARAPEKWRAARRLRPMVHGCFRIVRGPVANWEKGKRK